MKQTSTQPFDPIRFEPHWHDQWEAAGLFQQTAEETSAKPKRYLLFAFAYPSGSGLHVGHVESKTALDILARHYRMKGEQVFFPVGWDAFGLPAENYAIKTGVPPVTTTKQAIDTFRRQIKRLAISYDWASEIATCHPGYYHWTQWLFLQLFEKGLAYRGLGTVNWCPSCQTVLANEQVVNGACERCGTEVVQKQMEQWYFKITEYQDELITGLDQVDWPAATKQQQLNWIGKSEGAQIVFQTKDKLKLEVYTTAHDTIFGCTFMVVAPEHTFLLRNRDKIKNWPEVEKYIKATQKKTEMDRQVQKQKTGVLVEGITFLNPVNGKAIPLFVADYVLSGYGTGAIMAVPGHDERDHEFAEKFHLPVIQTAQSSEHETTFIGYDKIKDNPGSFYFINSEAYDGLTYAVGREKMLRDFIAKGFAQKKSQYKLRDWLISRQRYWGAPIPIVYDPEGQPHPVKAEHLPWLLPTDVEFKPTGESPLTHSKEFVERTERLYGKGWRPEFDTMDTFVDSSWYYLRYVSARNETVFADADRLKRWLPVDFYMIGPEHIVLHLLYSRFFTKFLRDQGYLQFDEPFLTMRHQGMILGPDNKKMSKSKGNVINPDEVIEKFGADTLRTYEMFMGPIEADKPWDVRAVIGVYRFWQRFFDLVLKSIEMGKSAKDSKETALEAHLPVLQKLHRTIQKVSADIPSLKFNTAIAALMEFVNTWEAAKEVYLPADQLSRAIRLIAPFAPYLAEELYQRLQGTEQSTVDLETSVHGAEWPEVDPELAKQQTITLPVQVDGKLRGTLEVATDEQPSESEIVAQALSQEGVARWATHETVRRTVYIPGKVLSFVTK